MGSYENVGGRIRERLLALGYRRSDGEPDVQRFSWDHRFDKGHLHAWLADKMTPFKDLIRLCAALDCTAEWLLTGDDAKKGRPGSARRARRQFKNLSVVLTVGLSALGAPLPSMAAFGQTPPIGVTGPNNPSYRKPPRVHKSVEHGMAIA
jgi:hypothetical protein